MADEVGEIKKEMDEAEIFSVVDEIDATDVDLTFSDHEENIVSITSLAKTEPIEETVVAPENDASGVKTNTDVPPSVANNESVDMSSASVVSDQPEGEAEVKDDDDHEDPVEDEDEDLQEHPYLCLIESFDIPKEQMSITTIGKCKTLEDTLLNIINHRASLVKLLQTLKSVKEFALDFHIPSGEFSTEINLIAISTKDADYIIDAMKLKSELLLLTEVFINPKILKIVMKCDKVLQIFQEKLHLYLVNIFDVEKAGIALCESPHPHWSLFNTMKHDYSYDRGQQCHPLDLRARPLTSSVKTFWRAASHYMIYIYHDYKNKLLLKDAELYKKIVGECREACKKLYHAKSALKELHEEFAQRQKCSVEVLNKLYNWRNKVAKKVNKPVNTVLTKNAMMNLAAQLSSDPRTLSELAVSNFVKRDAETLNRIIIQAKMKFSISDKRIRRWQFESNAADRSKEPMEAEAANTPKNKRKSNDWLPNKVTPRSQNYQAHKNKKAKYEQPRQQSAMPRPTPLFSLPKTLSLLNQSNWMQNTQQGSSYSSSPAPVLLKPSSVPSNAVFQQANSEYMSLISAINRRDRDQLMQRTMPNLKMANEEMQNNVGFGNSSNRYQRHLTDMDQTIDLLEKRIGRIQETANRHEEHICKPRRYRN